MAWHDKYPHMLYISVLLLDGKIENWKVGNRSWDKNLDMTAYWKRNKMKDYKVQSIGFICKNEKEHAKVFDVLAFRWLKQWKYADDYKLIKAEQYRDKLTTNTGL